MVPFGENSHGRAGNRTRDLMISCRRLWPLDHESGHTGYLWLQKHTLNLFNTNFYSTATMVKRIHLTVTLHIHYLSCYIFKRLHLPISQHITVWRVQNWLPCLLFSIYPNSAQSDLHLLFSLWKFHLFLYSEDRTSWYILITKNQRDALISQIYIRNRTLHVSDSISVHHQQSSTVHTAIHTGYADCLLASGQAVSTTCMYCCV
jgi:hypothetical protein